jgi:hypothetical protein
VHTVTSPSFDDWLERLGYAAEANTLHVRGQGVSEDHPYNAEIKNLLRPDGAIRAQAVFDVEGVPTVVFFSPQDGKELSPDRLDAIRKRIWNQNLASIIIEVRGPLARALPARKLPDADERIWFHQARADGPFSALEVASANLSRRLPAWFDIQARVDRKLLKNLSEAVKALATSGMDARYDAYERRRHAQLLMGQILFISYLEHRRIVGETYRTRRKVGKLHDLIAAADRTGIHDLIDYLRQDFNGDFLGDDRHDAWNALKPDGLASLDAFLRRTDMVTGQGDFWNYDFSFIPVELLSGLYESFLSPDEQADEGAYYTPRHLATLAVDQAFATSDDPLSEIIFDGACGSGILLTAAYRRLIAVSETRNARRLTFRERKELLERHIFGADTNLMACRVTAFSLYLSLLEGLDPADILEAQRLEKSKLPPLADKNLLHGSAGDFFSPKHRFATRRFSLVISNPPWKEPKHDAITTADTWATRAKVPFVRRQIAGAFALRAADFLADNGRLCLILPIPQFLGPSSASFVSYFFNAVQPLRLINFGDLQALIFPTAENTCHVFVGSRRPDGRRRIPFGETFDYCVPKADMSLVYGRLTMQSADRHDLQTISVAENPQLLVTLMWGDANDVALWTRLSSLGTFADLWTGPKKTRPWLCRKGVHFHDQSREAVSAKRLRDKPFIPVEVLRAGSPVLHRDLLQKWPDEQTTVAGLGDELLSVFDGPRILFPDGFSRGEHFVRAVYYDGPGTFKSSIGVVSARGRDPRLLQFATVYLRSSLAQYFLMMRGWKMLCERNGVHLKDVETFPFFSPDQAPNPKLAAKALAKVSAQIQHLSTLPQLDQANHYAGLRDALDECIFDYFNLTETDRQLVRETVTIFMPSIRPRSFKSLDTPIQRSAQVDDFRLYSSALGSALTSWRDRTAGRGRFHVRVLTSDPGRAGPVGIARIAYSDGKNAPPAASAQVNDEAVQQTLAELRHLGLAIIPAGDAIQLVPDVHLWTDGVLYLVRPLAHRNWTLRQALRDVEHIVRAVQSKQLQRSRPEVA